MTGSEREAEWLYDGSYAMMAEAGITWFTQPTLTPTSNYICLCYDVVCGVVVYSIVHTYYVCEDCQTADWTAHKPMCKEEWPPKNLLKERNLRRSKVI